jgi:regulation of enolase protein 1 (concanavalin A-like superfamily)
LDGASWVSLGSVTQALSNPSLGIFVGASPGGFPNADMVWAEIITGASGGAPAISRTPASLSASTTQGANALSQSFQVSNAGGGTLSYTISDDASWLSCSPVSGTSTGELDTIAVSYSTSGLAVGTYTATISIAASGASNSPQTVPVTLTVNAVGGGAGHYDFNYPDRTSLLAAGWDFNAVTAAGGIRNTEQTTGAVVSYDQVAHPGVLRIPCDVGDLWAGLNNTRNTLFRDLPSNWTSIRLKLSFAPTQNYQQAGLVAYQDDDNYVQVTRIFENGNNVTFAREAQGGASIVNSVSQTATQGLALRLDRVLATETITGYYSLDGASWVSLGSVTQALTNPSLGIVVGASPGGFPNADLVWAEIVSSP